MKRVHHIVSAALAASLGLSGFAAQTSAEMSANISAVSDYVWRGVSQTGHSAAVQGGVDYEAGNGFAAGVWASNTGGGSNELDVYASYGQENNGFEWSIAFTQYLYPTIDDANFGEVLFDASAGVFSFGVSTTVVSDVEDAAFTEGDVHAYIGGSFELDDVWSLGVTLGMYEFDADSSANEISYTYFAVDLGKSLGEFGDFNISLSKAGEESGEEDPLVWVGWSKSF